MAMADVLNYDDVCISELDAYLLDRELITKYTIRWVLTLQRKMVSQVFILLYGTSG